MTGDRGSGKAYRGLFRRYLKASGPLAAAAGERSRPRRLTGVRAVLFDVYGTLLVSDPEAGPAGGKGPAALAAEQGLPLVSDALPALLAGEIERAHRAAYARTDYPEIDIIHVWDKVLGGGDRDRIKRFALAYELVTHPCRPTVDLASLFRSLHARGLRLGIVSNAQFYTPLILEHLARRPLTEIGFDKNLLLYSYRYRTAKPSRQIFQKAAGRLAALGIEPAQALFIGDSGENDVRPAKEAGFQTALFLGGRPPAAPDSDGGAGGQNASDAVFSDWNEIDNIIE